MPLKRLPLTSASTMLATIPEEEEVPRPRRRQGVINIDAINKNKPLPPKPSLSFIHNGNSFDFPLPPPASRPRLPTSSLSNSHVCTAPSGALPGISSEDNGFLSPRYVQTLGPAPTKAPAIIKNDRSISTFTAEAKLIDSDSEPESDTEEASEWYAREFSEFITISSPFPPQPSVTSAAARPDTALVIRTSSSAENPGSSVQLKPNSPRCGTPISDHVPSPLSVVPSVSLRANRCPRPPPRMSLPADVVPHEIDSNDGSDCTSSVDSQHRKDEDAKRFFESALGSKMDVATWRQEVDRKKHKAAVKSTITPTPSRSNMKGKKPHSSPKSDSTSTCFFPLHWAAHTHSTPHGEPRSFQTRVLNAATSRLGNTATKKPKEKVSTTNAPSTSRPMSSRIRARVHGTSGSMPSVALSGSSGEVRGCSKSGIGSKKKPILMEMFSRSATTFR